MRIVKTIIAVCCLILLAGCDSGDGIFGGSSTNVSFTVDCNTGITCKNTSDISEYNSGNYHSVTCTWYCADYKDRDDIYVSLSFRKYGSACWEMGHEYTSDGICD